MRYRALPGGDLVTTGLCDLECGVESEASLLISIGEPRLRRLGMQVTNPLAGSEHRLYERLAAVDPRAVGKQARAPGAVQEATKYTDVRELLAKQRDLDAIIIAAPDHVHATIAAGGGMSRHARWAAVNGGALYGARPAPFATSPAFNDRSASVALFQRPVRRPHGNHTPSSLWDRTLSRGWPVSRAP